jgi:transketolase
LPDEVKKEVVYMYKLSVPYSDKHEAAALGAKWNPELRSWILPSVASWRKFSQWLSVEQIQQIRAELDHKKAKLAERKKNGAALLEMLDPFPNDSLEDL